MARMTSMEALDQDHKIEKAQELVGKRKKLYDEATSALSDLLDKRDSRTSLIKTAHRI